MNTIRKFEWLAGMAFSAPLFLWPVTALLAGLAIVAIAMHWRRISKLPTNWWLLLAMIYLSPVFILFWGALLGHGDYHTPAPRWPIEALNSFLLLLVGISAYLVWRARGLRIAAFAFLLPACWFGFWALLIAGMSLSNVWL